MTDLHALKIKAAQQALSYIQDGEILGVGTGSTVDCFIALLPTIKHKIKAAVSSSERSTVQLIAMGIEVLDLNDVESFSVYIDGADEFDPNLCLIKGGGAALTREKIVAVNAKTFVCIADHTKRVQILGEFPLPVEVIPMAARYVAQELGKLGGKPQLRQGVKTDNGNVILDVYGLKINDPFTLESQINNITGTVCNGIFARRRADHVIIAAQEGISLLSV